jgi:hypothetical protein
MHLKKPCFTAGLLFSICAPLARLAYGFAVD